MQTTVIMNGRRNQRTSALVPGTDICERDAALELLDMPGVNCDSPMLEVDDGTLTVDGKVVLSMPDALQATFAQLRTSRWLRRFSLGEQIDTDTIDAIMRHGVLRLRLPEKPIHWRRRLAVTEA